MCFSAEASISATVILSTIGYFTCKSVKQKQYLPLAIIPFLFALQQFSEGMIWLSYNFNVLDPTALSLFKTIFLVFAILLWPIYFPFAIFSAEQNPTKKKIIGFINLCGILVSSFFIYQIIGNNVSVKIVNYSIMYLMEKPLVINEWIVTGAYSLVVLLPFFITTIPLMKPYGMLLIISWLIAEYFYHQTFISVWCFLSAILSGYLYLLIRVNERIVQPQEVESNNRNQKTDSYDG